MNLKELDKFLSKNKLRLLEALSDKMLLEHLDKETLIILLRELVVLITSDISNDDFEYLETELCNALNDWKYDCLTNQE